MCETDIFKGKTSPGVDARGKLTVLPERFIVGLVTVYEFEIKQAERVCQSVPQVS